MSGYNHFEGKYEVELKYRLNSKAAFLSVLKKLDYEVMLENNIDFDCYYDRDDHALAKENKSICIRDMQPSGIKLWIVKGPEEDRCEAVDVSDVNKAKSMLETMGFRLALKMEKTRSIYFIGPYHITLDYLVGLGDFAEFAIMTGDATKLDGYRMQLIELAASFALSEENLESKSYRELITEV